MSETRHIPIARPHTGEEEWQALREPLEKGWITQGPKVAAFQDAFARWHRVRHAFATTSCTTGLRLILAAMEVGPGDEVIVPSFTWVATANVVVHCGATPVFVDIDPETYNADAARVAERVTPRTRAIVPIHLFGLCADVEAIAEAAPGVPIVEDAACAVGAVYQGRPAGGLGRAAAFSFHPRKVISTGEGGMVTTDDAALAERIDALRNHGASVPEEQRHHGPKPYVLPEFHLPGFNFRMTDLQGAVGLVQMEKLDRLLAERRRLAALYDEALADVPWLRTPRVPEGCEHAYQSYVCRVDEAAAPAPRNAVMEALQQKGVSTRPGTHAVHMLAYYRERFGWKPDDCPAARDADRLTMAIPLHNRMDASDVEYVVDAITSLG
jgi:dTDP-4-amino-4,6-dideoxygalactose transaminase